MAWLDCIQHEFQEATLDECGRLVWTKSPDKKPVERLPQIFWADHSPWDEANAWSTERTASSAVDAETVRREMKHLYRYANWLESKGLDWRHFPVRQAEQVLRIFRKHLVDERKAGRLRGSTVSNCMNAVIRFYRFANLHNLVGNTVPMWHDRHIAIPIADSCGFRRAVLRMSSDLSIPYRRVVGDQLEDGLLPLLSEDMNRLLRYTAEHETEELHLMLCHGFFTGARVGTNVTLTVTGLEIAREDRKRSRISAHRADQDRTGSPIFHGSRFS
ncbi:hypothetical protein [Cupriavidus metallidurans]|uniref:hypothetical protein n=1 Tax=Cupriavidus metallidurans TaxID=119219 RepID=UPI001648A700|nr:hypothetical protein [Cupriavidus metallidurans]